MATFTTNINIPLIEPSMPLLPSQFNNALDTIDRNVTPISHIADKEHWILWKPNTVYQKQDVFRTTTIPSWGYWEVTKAGTSGTTEPFGAGEGDTATDGTCEIVLRRLTTTGSVNSWQLWPTFKATTAYVKGDVFRTRTCPSWAFWVVTKAGTSDTTEPFATTEGIKVANGTMECQLSRILNSADVCTKKKALTYAMLF